MMPSIGCYTNLLLSYMSGSFVLKLRFSDHTSYIWFVFLFCHWFCYLEKTHSTFTRNIHFLPSKGLWKLYFFSPIVCNNNNYYYSVFWRPSGQYQHQILLVTCMPIEGDWTRSTFQLSLKFQLNSKQYEIQYWAIICTLPWYPRFQALSYVEGNISSYIKQKVNLRGEGEFLKKEWNISIM